MKTKPNEKKFENVAKKNDVIINTMSRWIHIMNAESRIEDILYEFGFKNIAIYGMGHIGKLLYEQLCNSKVNISYVIDRKTKGIAIEVPVYSCEDILPQVDAIIVTAIFDYDEICKQLEEKAKGIKIISFDDILYWN